MSAIHESDEAKSVLGKVRSTIIVYILKNFLKEERNRYSAYTPVLNILSKHFRHVLRS